MRKLAILIAAALATGAALGLAGTAQATPRLTFAHARAVIASSARADKPTAYSIRRCHRRSRTSVQCRVTEQGVVTAWSLNDQPITMTLISEDVVTLRGSLYVDQSEVLYFAN